METVDEIKLLLKGLKQLKSQLNEITQEEDYNTIRIFETYQRIANLSWCLEDVCWKIFGTRQTDNLQYLISDKK